MNRIAKHVLETTQPAIGRPQGTIIQSQKGDWVWWVMSVISILVLGFMVTHPEEAESFMNSMVSFLF